MFFFLKYSNYIFRYEKYENVRIRHGLWKNIYYFEIKFLFVKLDSFFVKFWLGNYFVFKFKRKEWWVEINEIC